ncbi:C2 domain-containing protein [Gongronella butleri]|nr:C2 domain-containing protein [Gongronella butleri]
MAQPKKLGELAVVALKARELPNREIVGKQDPFCVFRLGEEAKRTKTDYRGGQHPIWDDQVNLTVYEGKTKMYVQLYDEDAKREDLISEGTVDLATVIKDGEQDDWFQLTYKNRKAGEIYLEITFYSAASGYFGQLGFFWPLWCTKKAYSFIFLNFYRSRLLAASRRA